MDEKINFLNVVCLLLPRHFDLEVQHFIASQFALESNFGKSLMSACTKNYCGMKVPVIRATLCLNPIEKGKFCEYDGISTCVFDYVIWLTYNKFTRQDFSNLGCFVNHLKISGYCPDNDYIDKINSIYNQYYSPSKS